MLKDVRGTVVHDHELPCLGSVATRAIAHTKWAGGDDVASRDGQAAGPGLRRGAGRQGAWDRGSRGPCRGSGSWARVPELQFVCENSPVENHSVGFRLTVFLEDWL